MERLNDIMGRAAQRRPQLSNPRSSQDLSHLGQRAPQPQQPVSRRPLPEQRARLGQPPQAQMRRTTQHPQRLEDQQGLPNPTDRRPYAETNTQPTAYDERQVGPPLRRQASEGSPAYLQRSRAPQMPPPRPASNYYADNYTSGPHADVVDEWEEEEEEEEDETGMAYGDWEQDGKELLVYKRPEPAEPRTNYIPAAYQEQTDHTLERQTRVTRDLRDMRMPAITAPVATPQARTQDVQRYRRMTQPLHPQTIADITREHTQDARTLHQPAPHETPMPQPPSARYTCPKCKGAGYLRANVPYGHPNFGKPIACSCKEAEKKEKLRQQLRDMSNLDAFHNQSFKTFNSRVPGVQEGFQAALNFAESPYGWLLLIGPNGCGKTHLAAAIANQSLDSGVVVLFEAVPDLLDHLRAAFAPTANEVYDQLFTKMRDAQLLVLDDLGAQQSSPWANEKLFQLLNHRYNMGLSTVITANPKGLQGIDERIRSRLMDNSLVTRVNLDRAHDFRPNQPKRRS